MNTTKEERKQVAIKTMKELNIYLPYIDGFKEKDNVCFFENYGGFWAFQEPELMTKIKEIEEKYSCTVFAVTHEYANIGECYDLLIVSDYKEEWDDIIQKDGNTCYMLSYVWNKDDEWCSELGIVGIKCFGGGIKRVC